MPEPTIYLTTMTIDELWAERVRLRDARRAMLYRMAEISDELDVRVKADSALRERQGVTL